MGSVVGSVPFGVLELEMFGCEVGAGAVDGCLSTVATSLLGVRYKCGIVMDSWELRGYRKGCDCNILGVVVALRFQTPTCFTYALHEED